MNRPITLMLPGLVLCTLASFAAVNAGGSETLQLQHHRGIADFDGDGIIDDNDNCVEDFNPDQRDTNGDGFGNICDPDLDNDGLITNFGDLVLFKAAFLSTPVSDAWSADADLNGDDIVNFLDLLIMKNFFLGPPGPIVNRFINPDGGNWHDPTNWSLAVVPNIAHTVRIDLAPGMIVTYSTGNSEISSMVANSDFALSGGMFWVRGEMQVNAPFAATGGTILNAAILAPTTADLIDVAGTLTLDGVGLGTDVMVASSPPNSSLAVINNLVLDDAVISLAAGSNLNRPNLSFTGANGATSILSGTGTVIHGNNVTTVQAGSAGHGLIIGPGITLRSGAGGGGILKHGIGDGPITLQGAIVSDVPGIFFVNGFPLTIEGSLRALTNGTVHLSMESASTIAAGADVLVDGGQLRLYGDGWVSHATLSITNGTLDIGDNATDTWLNAGLIDLTDSTIRLGGDFTVNDLGIFTSTGNVTTVIDGVLDNTGLDLAPGTLPGNELSGIGGRIVGGTVSSPFTVSSGFTLDTVSLLSADVTVDASGNSTLIVENGLTLNGATIMLAAGSNLNRPNLSFTGANGATSILSGTGTVIHGNSVTTVQAGSAGHGLIIGPGITLRSGAGGGGILKHGIGDGPITLQGAIVSDVPGIFFVNGFPLTIEGSLRALTNGTVHLSMESASTIAAGADVLVDGGQLRLYGDGWVSHATLSITNGTLDIGDNATDTWLNAGLIDLTDSTIRLGGDFTVNDLGIFTSTGNVTTVIDGVLDNTGLDLAPGTLPGNELSGIGGRIVGGTVSSPFTVSSGFTLDTVSLLSADVTVDASGNSTLIVENGLTLNGATIMLAAGSNLNRPNLSFTGANGATSILSGTGTVIHGNSVTTVQAGSAGHGLIIGPGITLRSGAGGGGILKHGIGDGPITLQGAIVSDVPGIFFVNGFPLTIEGNVLAAPSCTVNIGSTYTLASSAVIGVEIGAPTQFGRVTATGQTANLDGTLDISLVNGYVPTLGETFEIMTFGTRNGMFASETGMDIGGGSFFQTNYNVSNVTLEVIN